MSTEDFTEISPNESNRRLKEDIEDSIKSSHLGWEVLSVSGDGENSEVTFNTQSGVYIETNKGSKTIRLRRED